MQVKPCTKCGVQKPLEDYHCNKNAKDGRAYHCKACASTYLKGYDKANRAARTAKEKAWREANRDRVAARQSAYGRKWYAENKVRLKPIRRAAQIAYAERFPHLIAAYAAKRRASVIRATPPWANADAIKAVYEEAARLTRKTGVLHHVDHAVPLRSPIVCGLHCEANLWILPARVNLQKSNRYWPGGPL